MLDEPANGLDPEGNVHVRDLLRRLAREGRTVLVSSHLMSETAAFADHLLVLARGRLLADLPLEDFLRRHGHAGARVRTSAPARLRAALRGEGYNVVEEDDGCTLVEGVTAEHVGTVAARERVPILQLTDERATLEQAYLALTSDETEFASARRSARSAAREA